MTDDRQKNKNVHIFIKSIHLLFYLESKKMYL